MRSLNTLPKRLSLSFILLFLLFSSTTFGQENSIEDRFQIDELNQKIRKNNEKIEDIEESLDIIGTIESSLIANSTLNETELKKTIEKFKTLPSTDPWKVQDHLNRIDRYMARAVISFRQIIDKYERSADGNIDIIIYLGNLAENLRNVYPEPDFITYSYDEDDGSPNIDEAKFAKYKDLISIEYLAQQYSKIIKAISTPISERKKALQAQLTQFENDNKQFREDVVKLQVEIEGKSAYDRTVIKWGFPIFIFFILAIYLVPLYFVYRRENLDGERTENLYRMIYGSGLVTEIITVFLLTSTILLLGITDKLAPEILGTLIGGISGYVLGRSFNNSETMKNNMQKQAQKN